jgi:hypothetical protein
MLKAGPVHPDRNVYLRFAHLMNGGVKYYESVLQLQGISLKELVGSD